MRPSCWNSGPLAGERAPSSQTSQASPLQPKPVTRALGVNGRRRRDQAFALTLNGRRWARFACDRSQPWGIGLSIGQNAPASEYNEPEMTRL